MACPLTTCGGKPLSMVPSRTQGYDAIVVGAGLSGGTLAYRLAKRDLRVLVLERGDFLRLPPWRAGDPIGIHIRSAPARPSVVGGPTKFYGAAMYRMRESDFRAIRHEAGESPAWPITYNDLEPYYCEAEELYRVHGSTEEDPTEPPHSVSYPYPPLPHAPMVSELVDRLRNSGTTVSPMPRALDYGPGGKCVLCSTCDAYYCRLDAKMDADVAALRPALRSGRVDLVTQARCLRILTNERGTKTTGVLMERDEKQETVHANIVAVCAGLGPSAALLLDSRTSRHPAGLGNSTGCVGRYYGGHDTGMVFPLLSFTGSLPPMHTKTFSINTYYNGAPDWPYPMGVIQADAVVEEGACKAGGKAQYLLFLHDRGASNARIRICVRWRTHCRNAATRAKPKHIQETPSPRHRSVQEGGISGGRSASPLAMASGRNGAFRHGSRDLGVGSQLQGARD